MAFNQSIQKFTTKTKNLADNFNDVNEKLLENTLYNKHTIELAIKENTTTSLNGSKANVDFIKNEEGKVSQINANGQIFNLAGEKGSKGAPGTASTAINDDVINEEQTWTSKKIKNTIIKYAGDENSLSANKVTYSSDGTSIVNIEAMKNDWDIKSNSDKFSILENITFTKLVIGDGTGDLSLGVANELLTLPIINFEKQGNKVKITAKLDLSSVKQGFWWRECGLYAMDPDVGEVIYNYAYSTKPDFIASSDSGMMEEILVSMVATVGSNTNVDITIDSSMVFTSKKEFTPVKSKLDDICINVKDFGAVGDGITDDTLHIQNAINYALENKVSKVFLPSGDFFIERPLTISGTYFEFCGASNNIGGTTRLICKSDGIHLTGGSRYITISNMRITKTSDIQKTGVAIKMFKGKGLDIHLVTVKNMQISLFDKAITCGKNILGEKDSSFMWNCTFKDIRIDSCNSGFDIAYLNGSPNFGILFERVYCNDCAKYINASGLDAIFNCCNFGITSHNTIELSGNSMCVFNQCNFECDSLIENTGSCVPIIGISSKYISFVSCTFLSNVSGNVSFIRSYDVGNTLIMENCSYKKKYDSCNMTDFIDRSSSFAPFNLKFLNGCNTIPRLNAYSHQKSYTLDLDRNILPSRNKNTAIIKDTKYIRSVVFSDELQKPIIFCGLDAQGEVVYKDFMGNVLENGTF